MSLCWQNTTTSNQDVQMAMSQTIVRLTQVTLGLFSCFLILAGYDSIFPTGLSPLLSQYVGFIAVWIPLIGILIWVFFSEGKSLQKAFWWGFKPRDLIYGIAGAVFLKSMWVFVEIPFRHQSSTSIIYSVSPFSNIHIFLLSLIFPVLMAPLIEELFFRGVVLRVLLSLSSTHETENRLFTTTAVILSSLIFGSFHIIGQLSLSESVEIFLSTTLLSLTAGFLFVQTHRLGSALVLHVSFNAITLLSGIL